MEQSLLNLWKIIKAALTLNLAFLTIACGLYGLIIENVAAKQRNHVRASRFSQRLGWVYIIIGLSIIALRFFS